MLVGEKLSLKNRNRREFESNDLARHRVVLQALNSSAKCTVEFCGMEFLARDVHDA